MVVDCHVFPSDLFVNRSGAAGRAGIILVANKPTALEGDIDRNVIQPPCDFLNLGASTVSMVAIHLWPQSELEVAEARLLFLPGACLLGTT